MYKWVYDFPTPHLNLIMPSLGAKELHPTSKHANSMEMPQDHKCIKQETKEKRNEMYTKQKYEGKEMTRKQSTRQICIQKPTRQLL